MVHHTAEAEPVASRTPRRIASALTVVVVSFAAALTGCGGGAAPTDQQNVGPGIQGPLELADCSDWNAASLSERLGTVRDIREFAGGPVGTGGLHGATLDDQDAYDLFENYCANDFARGFKLYKLYTRAAAFGGTQ